MFFELILLFITFTGKTEVTVVPQALALYSTEQKCLNAYAEIKTTEWQWLGEEEKYPAYKIRGKCFKVPKATQIVQSAKTTEKVAITNFNAAQPEGGILNVPGW